MKYLIANWKMKLAPRDEFALAKEIAQMTFSSTKLSLILAPSFLSMERISLTLKNTPILLASQNCFWENSGAYTGETSPAYLKSLGCSHVIIGHSERRIYLFETPENINKKVRSVIDEMLVPILCVGESMEERRSGAKDHIVRRQIETALEKVELVGNQKLIIAYEPVWAIGTGHAAKVSEVLYMLRVIHQALIDTFPRAVCEENTAILYGGSVDSENINEFCEENEIQGALIGSSSIKAKEFNKILTAMQLYA
ncbi:MAG: triose-phosphate isomerase [Candidatus Jacksonbacteria bacterium RIFOXYA2_FULL_44_7]|uniref:Triosephosphate isomerase n=1 Tax=Candidatus Jacksonbacteria bacterium RIFCSPLOWO2_02_FULL_44_20 TaxID=1798460 RepID=A0A1G2AAV2_9BACT|nr:MAG: Triosephosphate isomerase [Parcubacteria group bacterium GW2011_GWF2_44_17]OGY70470.1 MAG: triose-phosphate isomerase [Candidatus Jacksonbacteria bacterium RIFCSPHIGHO2_02_FULL_44_25]OGY73971.1 MAG: triose-phosphate isomerase [Candidatus Jacksonbacteria bacterium RIFCSPLOWO2_02_FULL_44_20]OGY74093.1 MAG: triose-phosphate isomerase [Candidatus Jacksonbacteria bacterium RIFCSPLOWO2_12_FULL_44_15b]OGY77289.1 MAG: triose-phosphate isomerase [Candidatus Jacksonbacteria bacterium RIFOXYA2_FUL